MERFDSLPRVEEESEDSAQPLPHLEIISTNAISDTEYEISFSSSGAKTIVILNDAVLGTTDQNHITITNLDNTISNTITLVPLSSSRRGESVSIELKSGSSGETTTTKPPVHFTIPKAPNTGSHV